MSNSSTEITRTSRLYNDDVLASISTFQDALDATATFGGVEDFSLYGSGFDVLPTADKARLVGVPFVILSWKFSEGDNGEFVSAEIVTRANEKLIINDGSTGIRAQLKRVALSRLERGADDASSRANLLVSKGLTVSRYQYADDKTGELRSAETYYLAG